MPLSGQSRLNHRVAVSSEQQAGKRPVTDSFDVTWSPVNFPFVAGYGSPWLDLPEDIARRQDPEGIRVLPRGSSLEKLVGRSAKSRGN